MNPNSPHEPETADAEDHVLTAMRQLMSLPDTLASIHHALERVGTQLNALREAHFEHQKRCEQSEESLLAISQGLEALFRKQDVLDRTSQQQTLLAERHYHEHVIVPLARHVSPIHDWSAELLLNGKGAPLDDRNKIGELVKAMQAQIMGWLAVYGIEPLNAAPGCRYDPKTMRALNESDANGAGQNLIVSESVRIGLRCGERILREQVVRVRRVAGPKKWNLR